MRQRPNGDLRKGCGPACNRLILTLEAMPQAKVHFTNVTSLRPEAIGEPGRRTFRMLVDSGSSSAIIWLEKEQLLQLALGIHQLLVTLSSEEKEAPGAVPSDREAPGLTRLDLRADKIVLGHDDRSGLFVIDAHDQGEEEEGATVRVWADRERVKGFAEEALRVCAAGRPLCPLCGRPIDPTGHHCSRLNGHVQPTDL